VVYRRVSADMMKANVLDLKRMLKSHDLSEDMHLRPGDIVYVPQNSISKIKPFIPVPGVGVSVTPVP
jgi:protein involved in polysaccharide export with SLBB domain